MEREQSSQEALVEYSKEFIFDPVLNEYRNEAPADEVPQMEVIPVGNRQYLSIQYRGKHKLFFEILHPPSFLDSVNHFIHGTEMEGGSESK